jgi:dienelactone hydrolase
MKENRNCAACLAAILILFLLPAFSSGIQAQTPPLWGGLKPGDFGVGFRTIEKYDFSRTFRSKIDYFGETLPGENARPIQICIWYPALTKSADSYLILGEYLFPYPGNSDFFAYLTGIQQRSIQQIGVLLANNQGLLLDASEIEMGAVRDAPLADGSFPLIIYFPGLINAVSDNMVLCEFLASHGFVVMTTHQVGTTSANPLASQIDFETIVRDKEFALANIMELDFINFDKIGVFGADAGGLAALLAQMRNFDIDAVASLAGWNIDNSRFEFALQNPCFNPRRMDKPMLQVYYEDQIFNMALLDSLKYSERLMLKLGEPPSGGFTSYPAVVSFMDTLNVNRTISRPTYELTCQYLLDFYNNFLKSAEVKNTLAKKPADPVTMEYKSAMELPPTPDQFTAIIGRQGGAQAVELYWKFDKIDSGCITFQEAAINFLGYRALQSGQNDDALALFKLNADIFPNSANCWDSYSDGLQAVGDTAEAISCYKKVLEVLPADTLVGEQLRTTLRNNAEAGITRLSN